MVCEGACSFNLQLQPNLHQGSLERLSSYNTRPCHSIAYHSTRQNSTFVGFSTICAAVVREKFLAAALARMAFIRRHIGLLFIHKDACTESLSRPDDGQGFSIHRHIQLVRAEASRDQKRRVLQEGCKSVRKLVGRYYTRTELNDDLDVGVNQSIHTPRASYPQMCTIPSCYSRKDCRHLHNDRPYCLRTVLDAGRVDPFRVYPNQSPPPLVHKVLDHGKYIRFCDHAKYWCGKLKLSSCLGLLFLNIGSRTSPLCIRNIGLSLLIFTT